MKELIIVNDKSDTAELTSLAEAISRPVFYPYVRSPLISAALPAMAMTDFPSRPNTSFLDGLDIDAEYRLIKAKKSKLSARQRKMVEQRWARLYTQQPPGPIERGDMEAMGRMVEGD